jgi:hypothetical protein
VDVASVAKAVEMDGQEMMSRRIKVKEADVHDGKPQFGGTPNGAPKPVRGGDAGGYWRDDRGQKHGGRDAHGRHRDCYWDSRVSEKSAEIFFASKASIDVNKQIMGARGASERCNLLDAT